MDQTFEYSQAFSRVGLRHQVNHHGWRKGKDKRKVTVNGCCNKETVLMLRSHLVALKPVQQVSHAACLLDFLCLSAKPSTALRLITFLSSRQMLFFCDKYKTGKTHASLQASMKLSEISELCSYCSMVIGSSQLIADYLLSILYVNRDFAAEQPNWNTEMLVWSPVTNTTFILIYKDAEEGKPWHLPAISHITVGLHWACGPT